MPIVVHPVLLDLAYQSPTHADLMRSLHDAVVCVTVVVALGAALAFLDKFDLLTAPWRESGLRIPILPTLAVLVVLAGLLAWPEINDYRETGHRTTSLLQAQTLEDDALLELMKDPMNECVARDSQHKFDEARAIALDELGEGDQAKEVRDSQPADAQCLQPQTAGQ